MNFKRMKTNGEVLRRNLIYSSLMKIIINHFQFFSFLRFMNFKWDVFTTNFLAFLSYFGDIAESSSAIDCVILEGSYFSGLYFKFIIFAIFPIFVLMIVFFGTFFKRKYGRMIDFTIVSLISLDLSNPSVINTLIESMTCYEFEENQYLRKDMSYQCYTQTHLYKVNRK